METFVNPKKLAVACVVLFAANFIAWSIPMVHDLKVTVSGLAWLVLISCYCFSIFGISRLEMTLRELFMVRERGIVSWFMKESGYLAMGLAPWSLTALFQPDIVRPEDFRLSSWWAIIVAVLIANVALECLYFAESVIDATERCKDPE